MIALAYQHTSLSDLLVAATAVSGAIAVFVQMKRTKDLEEGSFIVELNNSFITNENIQELYNKLVSGKALQEGDRAHIVEYLTFFEVIQVLNEQKLVDLAVLDDLFYYRFSVSVCNKSVQDLELIHDAKYYRNIYTLDHDWREYRRKHHKEVFDGDGRDNKSLENAKPNYENFVKVRKWK